MSRKTYSSLLICSFLILTSCASSYKSINPERVQYGTRIMESGIEFSYKYNVLKESGNKKYAKKEDKKNLQLVAVRVTNRSDSQIIFEEDVTLYAGGRMLRPIDPDIIKSQLKQNAPLYLLYSLLWLQISSCEDNECDTTNLPIGVPIALGNMAVAGSANGKLLEELNEYDILDRPINPGETVYGIIGIKDTGYNPLTIQIRD
ncbi:MAG: hypothetical protein RLN81_06480 [Balneolaceae bacterium]